LKNGTLIERLLPTLFGERRTCEGDSQLRLHKKGIQETKCPKKKRPKTEQREKRQLKENGPNCKAKKERLYET